MVGSSVRRVVVGVSGSLANRAALHAAASLASRCSATLLAVHVVPKEETDSSTELHDALEELRVHCLHVDSVVIAGRVPAALVGVATEPGDVLVIGSGRQRRLRRWRTGPVHRACIATARCLVMTVPPPPMINELPRALSA